MGTDGLTEKLLVVGAQQFETLSYETHNSDSLYLRHLGIRKTFAALSKAYFAFGGRGVVLKVVSKCCNWALNRVHAARAERSGNQLSLVPNVEGMIDVAGPIHGFGCSPSMGRPRYVLCYVDLHSQLALATVISSTDDLARG